MKFITILFIQLFVFNVICQVTFDKTKHDFGQLESYDDRFVDFKLTNQGTKKEYVLSVKKPREVNYIISKQFIEKDSSIQLRFQINPSQKGKFNYTIEVFTSDRSSAVQLQISGNLKELSIDQSSSFTACPDFNSRPSQSSTNFKLTVITIDKVSKEPLANSTVSMIQNGIPQWSEQTDQKGKIVEEGTLGFTYFYATNPLYNPAETDAYINFQRNVVVLELTKNDNPYQAPEIIESNPVITQQDTNQDTTNTAENNTAVIDLDQQLNKNKPIVAVELQNLDANDFSEEHFKPVNVTFVLDISSSMNQGKKMELMKYSLIQLIDMLRPCDQISLITFSENATILLPKTNGAEKTSIKEKVEKLKASGMTAGGKGIKMGYFHTYKSKINEGTNQVIIITDGAFNRNSDDYMKYVKKYKKKGINLSVVGIAAKEPDKEKMGEAAKNGGGSFVVIDQLLDAQNNLKQEIRVISFKK